MSTSSFRWRPEPRSLLWLWYFSGILRLLLLVQGNRVRARDSMVCTNFLRSIASVLPIRGEKGMCQLFRNMQNLIERFDQCKYEWSVSKGQHPSWNMEDYERTVPFHKLQMFKKKRRKCTRFGWCVYLFPHIPWPFLPFRRLKAIWCYRSKCCYIFVQMS